jgi:hypothetical protein
MSWVHILIRTIAPNHTMLFLLDSCISDIRPFFRIMSEPHIRNFPVLSDQGACSVNGRIRGNVVLPANSSRFNQ